MTIRIKPRTNRRFIESLRWPSVAGYKSIYLFIHIFLFQPSLVLTMKSKDTLIPRSDKRSAKHFHLKKHVLSVFGRLHQARGGLSIKNHLRTFYQVPFPLDTSFQPRKDTCTKYLILKQFEKVAIAVAQADWTNQP